MIKTTRLITVWIGMSALLTGCAISAVGSGFATLHAFDPNPDGFNPTGSLVRYGSTLYGMTDTGGVNFLGTIFSIPVGGGTPTILHSFAGGTDAASPQGSLTLSADGNTLYGMTLDGGPDSKGTIFSIPTAGGTLTVLYSFTGCGYSVCGSTDGAWPYGNLTLSGSTLYGMTQLGGTHNFGMIFSIPITGGTPTQLYSFTDSGTDGGDPQASLIISGSTLYGMTYGGGTGNCGTIYSLPTTGGSKTNLYNFTGVGTDGCGPFNGSLTLSLDATTLYGMTTYGGADHLGTVFSLPVGGGTPTTLHSFTGVGTDGSGPLGSLILSGSTLYGMTQNGGLSGDGVLFSIPVTGGAPTTLYSFTGVGTDGTAPAADLIISGSTLYGMTPGGGSNNAGTIFSAPASGGTPTTLYSFTNVYTAAGSIGSLVLSGNTLYGMSDDVQDGSIFSEPVAGGASTTLYEFTGIGTDASSPIYGSFVLSGSTLYGMTIDGGANGVGTIFTEPLGGGTPTTLYSFTGIGTDGANPYASLVLSLDGNTLYGMTSSGGSSSEGTIFSEPVTGGTPTILYSFTGVGTDGASPSGSLILSGSTLYGMTGNGGANGFGTIFSIPVTGGTPTILYSFTAVGTDGGSPIGDLILSGGILYGMTYSGGTSNLGTIFSEPIGGGTPTTLHSFTGVGTDGANPFGNLIISSGMFYGTTNSGGSSGFGTIFKIPLSGGTLTTLHTFTGGTDGGCPEGSLIISGTTLYGGNVCGGVGNNGTVFQFGL
jgi:uncharacterized repeat protein (TIGR03803 family)